jgi:hypothetical protein
MHPLRPQRGLAVRPVLLPARGAEPDAAEHRVLVAAREAVQVLRVVGPKSTDDDVARGKEDREVGVASVCVPPH